MRPMLFSSLDPLSSNRTSIAETRCAYNDQLARVRAVKLPARGWPVEGRRYAEDLTLSRVFS